MQIIGSIFKAIIGLAMIGAVAVAGVAIFSSSMHLSTQLIPQGQAAAAQATAQAKPIAFVISPGETSSEIASDLKNQGVIGDDGLFKLQLRLSGKETQIKAGTFQLTTNMDNSRVIDVLSAPVEAVPSFKITVIEGLRLEEVAERLSGQGVISATRFMQLAGTPEGIATLGLSDDFMKASGKPDSTGLEGYLFPDTYEIKQQPGDNSEAIIKTMYSTMEDRITPDMRQALAAKNHTVQQLLIIASIVQREGVLKTELPKIASVYWNRVDKGMLLNADPTIQYAVGTSGDWWPVLSLDQLKVDSPYNTYTTTGLPPSPICAPGLDAITAAVYPEDTNYLYFVAKSDGSHGHLFATTYEEQQRNQVLVGNK